MEDQIIQDLTKGPVRRQLLLFSWPIIVANLLQTVYSLVDMIVVGQYVGPAGLSAVGIGSSIAMVFLVIGMGISGAGQTLIAQQIGAKDSGGLNATIGTLFSMLILASVLFGGICVSFSHPLLKLLNTPEEAFSNAAAYTLICGCGMLFIYGYNAVSSILRGMGESKIPLIIIAIASGLNLLLDLVFVAGFHMGAGGAALATVIAQAVAFVFAVAWLYRHCDIFGFDFKPRSFLIERRRFAVLLKIAVPYVVQGLMITVSMAFINARVNVYGVTASAVDSVGQKLNNMLYIVSGALSTSAAAMMGQCFGARDFKRMESVYNNCLAICMIVFAVVSVVLLLFPTEIFRVFTSDELVVAMAPTYMKIVIVFFFAASTMVSPYAVIEGIGYASFGLVISLMDGVVARIGLGLVLEQVSGLNGLWLGNALAGLVTTVMSGIYYYSKRWTKRKVLLSKSELN